MNRDQRHWFAVALFTVAVVLHLNVGDWNQVHVDGEPAGVTHLSYEPEQCLRGFAREYVSVQWLKEEIRNTRTNDGGVYLALLVFGLLIPIVLAASGLIVLSGPLPEQSPNGKRKLTVVECVVAAILIIVIVVLVVGIIISAMR